jgi:hypothetical protein
MGHRSIKLALTLGFLVMAAFNVEGLIKVAEQRRALVDFFRTLKPPVLATSSGWIDPLLVPPVWQVVSVHCVADFMVVCSPPVSPTTESYPARSPMKER